MSLDEVVRVVVASGAEVLGRAAIKDCHLPPGWQRPQPLLAIEQKRL